MALRGRYWSNSKFAAWIYKLAGAPKPLQSGTAREWRHYKQHTKTFYPISYWIVEEGLDKLQDFVNIPGDFLYNIRIYLVNRFITRSHIAPTQLKKGVWHEVEEVLLHSMFELLVDFIEVQKAHMMTLGDTSARPWWSKSKWTNWGRFRSRELGLKHLEWEMTLTNAEWIEPGETPELTSQAVSAKEQLDLYLWWKDVRPNRPDPYDESGWSAYCEYKRQKNPDEVMALLSDEFETAEERQMSREALDKTHEMEQAYEKEDQEMMIRLIKIRRHLWT